MSESIEALCALARASGLISHDGQWSKAFVYYFDAPMPPCVREAGNSDLRLRYFSSEQTPHNPANEGFIDPEARVALTFETVQ